jgi:peptidoglycan/xylan/chitin deacetylase (PgdA/CDA1 family)
MNSRVQMRTASNDPLSAVARVGDRAGPDGDFEAAIRPPGPAARLSRAAAKLVPVRPARMLNRRPIVSITFDDVPDSAFTNGAAVLDRFGVKGTFYMAPGTCGQQEPFWRVISERALAQLAASGHEIGCHTFGHVSVQTLSRAAMAEETRSTRAALERICGRPPSANFAYPFGVASFQRKLQLDLAHLRSVELYDRTLGQARLDRLLDETLARTGWLVFFTHDCADPPSWIGCSPALLGRVVEACLRRKIAILPVDGALDEIVG